MNHTNANSTKIIDASNTIVAISHSEVLSSRDRGDNTTNDLKEHTEHSNNIKTKNKVALKVGVRLSAAEWFLIK